jgi:hypothetical protein
LLGVSGWLVESITFGGIFTEGQGIASPPPCLPRRQSNGDFCPAGSARERKDLATGWEPARGQAGRNWRWAAKYAYMRIPAKYDPDRHPNGYFKTGNTLGRGHDSETQKKWKSVQAAYYQCATPEHVQEVYNRHLDLIRQQDDLDVCLRAMLSWEDRFIGKVQDRVAVDVTSSGPLVVDNLNQADLDALNQIALKMGRTDEEIEVTPLE